PRLPRLAGRGRARLLLAGDERVERVAQLLGLGVVEVVDVDLSARLGVAVEAAHQGEDALVGALRADDNERVRALVGDDLRRGGAPAGPAASSSGGGRGRRARRGGPPARGPGRAPAAPAADDVR